MEVNRRAQRVGSHTLGYGSLAFVFTWIWVNQYDSGIHFKDNTQQEVQQFPALGVLSEDLPIAFVF